MERARLTFAFTCRRRAQRGGTPTASLLDGRVQGRVGRHHSDERNHCLRRPMTTAGASIPAAQATTITQAIQTEGIAPNADSKTVFPLRSS